MTASTNHYCFAQPASTQMRLWRYMDFTKFVAMLESESLTFCRSDLFKDPFEGSFSQANLALRPAMYSDLTPDQLAGMCAQTADLAKRVRQYTYISCWHANEHESAAMWDLYARTEEAVAIETTYQKLVDSLPSECYIGLVNYIDYQKDWVPEGNTFFPFVHKRKSFEHEHEVRSVIQDLKSLHDISSATPPVRHISVSLIDLIAAVHVSPMAPEWFATLVASVSKKYGLAAPVRKSDLYSSPVF